MSLKYFFDYKGIDGNDNRCEIYNDSYNGDAISVEGSVILTKVNDKDILKPTRGSGLKLFLEANLDLKFEDFQTTKERDFLVKYYRNNALHSIYWLSPEGLFEDFVSDKWIISLDCTDGLGFLNNLSYVDNITKETFTSKQTMMEVIVNCLKRTNIPMNIYTSINIFQNNAPNFNVNTFIESTVNPNRYIKDDNNTIMNCREVLESILEIFGAVITQKNGSWYIYKPNQLHDDSELTFFAYDSNGNSLNPTTIVEDLSITIGSQINNYYPYHINSNQQFSRISPIGAYRVDYKYGFVKSFFDNIELKSNNGIIPDWIINSPSNLTIPDNECGVIVKGFQIPTTQTLSSKTTTLQSGDSFVLEMVLSNIYLSGESSTTALRPKILLTDNTETYYVNRFGEWSDSDDSLFFSGIPYGVNDFTTFTITTNTAPISGNVSVLIYSPNIPVYSEILISKINLYPNETQPKDGQHFTFKNLSNESTKIADNKTVYNGDSQSDIYLGTIYESDTTTPTDSWYRNDGNFSLRPLLQIMGEERMAMYSNFSKVYKGDVFGYVDFMSVVAIDGFIEKFMPIEYSYDTSKNISSLKLLQINNDVDNNYNNIETTKVFYSGTTPSPTIKI